MLKERLKGGHNFILEANSEDLFNAIGISTCTVKANFDFKFDESTATIKDKRLSNISLKLTDWYDWDGKEKPAEIGYRGLDFAKGFFGKIRTSMFNGGELVANVLTNLNLPSIYLNQLTQTYNNGLFDFFGKLSDKAGEVSYDLEDKLTGGEGVSEADFSLLESVGAKQYEIYGSIYQSETVFADE